MLTLAEIDAAIAAADARRSRRTREAEVDYLAEVALPLALRSTLVAAHRAAAVADLDRDWLTFAEIAALRPTGKSRDGSAVRQAVYRRVKKSPDQVETRTLPNEEKLFRRDWLTRMGIIENVGGVAP